MNLVRFWARYAIPSVAALAACGCLALLAANALAVSKDDQRRVQPKASVQTEPVPSAGDAADDPAIWVHPTASERSLILGTDKKGGLNVFDLDGHRAQIVSDGSRPNNVDLIYGFPTGGAAVDLAVAGTRSRSRQGVGFWRIDPVTCRLAEFGPIPAFEVFGGKEPYGSCVYRNPKDGSFYVFITSKDGDVEQYRIEAETAQGAASPIRATRVRAFRVGSTTEGCVVDHELGWLYVAEEKVGIWRYGAGPDSGSSRTLIARVGENDLTADVEGLTIYYGPGTAGYLIASSQGASTFQVYSRDGENAFVMSIDPQAGAGISDVGETDGIDVTNVAMSAKFPRGLFVCQDGKGGRDGHQNFKYFAWDEIAGDRLIVNTDRRARPR
jgi:3-phytase